MYGQGGILMNIIVNLLVIEDDTGTCEMYREYSQVTINMPMVANTAPGRTALTGTRMRGSR